MTIPTSKLNKVPGITFESGPEAEDVLDSLKAIIESYGQATVADYRQLADLPVTFPDYKQGWTDLDEARIIYTKGEFMLDLPLVVNLP